MHSEDVPSDIRGLRSADLELAQQCVEGRPDAQRAFFHAHRKRVHCVLYRMLGSNREIDDLIQDAFFEIFRSLSGFRGEAQLGTWIDRICVRVAMRHFSTRDRARRPSLELVLCEDPAKGPERRVEAREAARRLYSLLDGIEPNHRIAFVLHVIEGRSLREVALLTETSVVATKLRVWRTRRRIDAAARQDPVLRSFVSDGERGGEP